MSSCPTLNFVLAGGPQSSLTRQTGSWIADCLKCGLTWPNTTINDLKLINKIFANQTSWELGRDETFPDSIRQTNRLDLSGSPVRRRRRGGDYLDYTFNHNTVSGRSHNQRVRRNPHSQRWPHARFRNAQIHLPTLFGGFHSCNLRNRHSFVQPAFTNKLCRICFPFGV